METTEKMYTTLFNGITDANEKICMAQKLIEEAVCILKESQLNAEEVFISTDDL